MGRRVPHGGCVVTHGVLGQFLAECMESKKCWSFCQRVYAARLSLQGKIRQPATATWCFITPMSTKAPMGHLESTHSLVK